MKNLYRCVIKLEPKLLLIQDYLNRALNNWAQEINLSKGKNLNKESFFLTFWKLSFFFSKQIQWRKVFKNFLY